MSYIIFDCSQFLTFDLSTGPKLQREEILDFESIGFEVLLNDKIVKTKQDYLRPYLQTEIVELIDQEFQGIFEDWKEVNNPPDQLLDLITVIKNFWLSREVENLKLIIIGYASENIEKDHLIEKTVFSDKFFEGLFTISKWNFNEVADNLILELKK